MSRNGRVRLLPPSLSLIRPSCSTTYRRELDTPSPVTNVGKRKLPTAVSRSPGALVTGSLAPGYGLARPRVVGVRVGRGRKAREPRQDANQYGETVGHGEMVRALLGKELRRTSIERLCRPGLA